MYFLGNLFQDLESCSFRNRHKLPSLLPSLKGASRAWRYSICGWTERLIKGESDVTGDPQSCTKFVIYCAIKRIYPNKVRECHSFTKQLAYLLHNCCETNRSKDFNTKTVLRIRLQYSWLSVLYLLSTDCSCTGYSRKITFGENVAHFISRLSTINRTEFILCTS